MCEGILFADHWWPCVKELHCLQTTGQRIDSWDFCPLKHKGCDPLRREVMGLTSQNACLDRLCSAYTY